MPGLLRNPTALLVSSPNSAVPYELRFGSQQSSLVHFVNEGTVTVDQKVLGLCAS